MEDGSPFLLEQIAEGEWPTIVRLLTALFHLPDELRGQLFTWSIPCLQEVGVPTR